MSFLTFAPTKMLGTVIYVSLLVVNSMAVLSEDRFLARIGWSSSSQAPNPNPAFQQTYDPQTGYGTPPAEVSMKARLIDLISAVRTLMRIPLIGFNIIIIIYEILLGGR
ncbi:ER-to-golgi transport membrane protein [Roridomyces roridus]|uniref:ER-to-golgi transport membrane protein n=1 Tax=Roridomyces roridus TaxID=1738132 RepID=A0AAD7FR96_9AGAR|nr:ER-to-golgi transport membrane protein [Roridomyces roridus]